MSSSSSSSAVIGSASASASSSVSSLVINPIPSKIAAGAYGCLIRNPCPRDVVQGQHVGKLYSTLEGQLRELCIGTRLQLLFDQKRNTGEWSEDELEPAVYFSFYKFCTSTFPPILLQQCGQVRATTPKTLEIPYATYALDMKQPFTPSTYERLETISPSSSSQDPRMSTYWAHAPLLSTHVIGKRILTESFEKLMPIEWFYHIMVQSLYHMTYLNKLGYYHLDLKLANLLFLNRYFPVWIDFGICFMIPPDAVHSSFFKMYSSSSSSSSVAASSSSSRSMAAASSSSVAASSSSSSSSMQVEITVLSTPPGFPSRPPGSRASSSSSSSSSLSASSSVSQDVSTFQFIEMKQMERIAQRLQTPLNETNWMSFPLNRWPDDIHTWIRHELRFLTQFPPGKYFPPDFNLYLIQKQRPLQGMTVSIQELSTLYKPVYSILPFSTMFPTITWEDMWTTIPSWMGICDFMEALEQPGLSLTPSMILTFDQLLQRIQLWMFAFTCLEFSSKWKLSVLSSSYRTDYERSIAHHLELFINRCFQLNPMNRFQDCSVALTDLVNFQSPSAIGVYTPRLQIDEFQKTHHFSTLYKS